MLALRRRTPTKRTRLPGGFRPRLAAGVLLLAAGASGACALAATPDRETLELSSGQAMAGRLVSMNADTLTFKTAEGDRQVPAPSLARLVRLPFRPTARKSEGLVLTCGDILEGEATELAGGKLKFQSGRFGPLDIDAKLVRGLFFNRPMDSLAATLAGETKAEVLLSSGSRTPAELRWLDSQKIGLSSPLGPLEASRADVVWVFLAGKPSPPAAGTHRVNLTTGECLTGRLVEIADGRVKVSWNGVELKLSLDVVRSMESTGEHLTFLSMITPAAQTAESAVGPARGPRPDACADGGTLRLDGRMFDRGIGMRASSKSTYSLDGSWQRFRARVGLDERAGAASRGAVFRVLGDGRNLFEKRLGPGDGGVEVDVPVGAVKELVLVLDSGPGLEVGDYGDWVDARLLR